MEQEQQLGIQTVNLHSNVSSSKLSDPKIWPRFTRLVATSEYMASSLSILFKVFGFKRCVFFYTPYGLSIEILDNFKRHAKRYGIDVLDLELGEYMTAEEVLTH
jgi:hypothetical protein